MGKIRPVLPAAFITGITFSSEAVMQNALQKLTGEFGPLAFQSDVFDFTMTDYYTAEMGENLKKRFCCFERPIEIGRLPDIKLFTNDVEMEFARGDDDNPLRSVNIDPGYVTLSKLVLATTKDYSHRIYIGKGIYGEITLHYMKGEFRPFFHTYPDHQTPLAIEFFNQVRDYIKKKDRHGAERTD